MKYRDEFVEWDDGNPCTCDVVELGGKLAEKRDKEHKAFCRRISLQRFSSDELFDIAKERKEIEEKDLVHTLCRDKGYGDEE